MSRTFALIPAAGKSSRMGRPKLALPLDGRLVIERVIDALHRAGVQHILVVVAPHVPELMTLAQAAGAEVLMLADETPDMRATVEAGLHWLERHFVPKPDDAWLLVPADHPVLDADVIRRLLQERKKHPDCSIVIPAYAGQRGHPALIDWKHVAGMRTLPAGQGLNVYLRSQAEETCEVLIDSPTVVMDLDTPEDYEKLQQMWKKINPKKPDLFWFGCGFFLWTVSLGCMFGLMERWNWLNGSLVEITMKTIFLVVLGGWLVDKFTWNEPSKKVEKLVCEFVNWTKSIRKRSGE